MGRNISDEFLAMPQQWTQEGEVIHSHMVTDAGWNMSVTLIVVGFEGIVFMVYKLHLAHDVIAPGRCGHSWRNATNWRDISHAV